MVAAAAAVPAPWEVVEVAGILEVAEAEAQRKVEAAEVADEKEVGEGAVRTRVGGGAIPDVLFAGKENLIGAVGNLSGADIALAASAPFT